ncbi:MAG: hypothetical protein KDC44_16840 [Phaeodactylibacter sp.]|nr:hypothetical protein [Phaeodactylibacter sp.]
MQRPLFVTILCLLFQTATFAQAAPSVQESAPSAPFELGTVQLTAPQIQAFQQRGGQKLNDFQELGILSADTSLAADFRAQAHKMLLELFETTDEKLFVFDKREQTLVAISAQQYADQLLAAAPNIQALRFEWSDQPGPGLQTDNQLYWTQQATVLVEGHDQALHCQIQLVAIRAFRQTGTYGQISWKTYIKGMSLLP